MSQPPPASPESEPRVSCRVERAFLARLEGVAASNGISVSAFVRMTLTRALPEYEGEVQTRRPIAGGRRRRP